MTIGERIKKIRMSKGLKQENLAKKMRFSRSRISSMEVGPCSPSVSTLELFAEALDVPIISLIDDGDWVEVTRCGDCSKYDPETGTCRKLNLKFRSDHYCGYADRRDDG